MAHRIQFEFSTIQMSGQRKSGNSNRKRAIEGWTVSEQSERPGAPIGFHRLQLSLGNFSTHRDGGSVPVMTHERVEVEWKQCRDPWDTLERLSKGWTYQEGMNLSQKANFGAVVKGSIDADPTLFDYCTKEGNIMRSAQDGLSIKAQDSIAETQVSTSQTAYRTSRTLNIHFKHESEPPFGTQLGYARRDGGIKGPTATRRVSQIQEEPCELDHRIRVRSCTRGWSDLKRGSAGICIGAGGMTDQRGEERIVMSAVGVSAMESGTSAAVWGWSPGVEVEEMGCETRAHREGHKMSVGPGKGPIRVGADANVLEMGRQTLFMKFSSVKDTEVVEVATPI
ncbi:hypothetical protein C8R43DRAFT_959772 [Mycena crocata]|nr:hypothetical protein C8R43DRAFT_959772 [Mycena crocata]